LVNLKRTFNCPGLDFIYINLITIHQQFFLTDIINNNISVQQNWCKENTEIFQTHMFDSHMKEKICIKGGLGKAKKQQLNKNIYL
jgi:hypothetical protein